MLTKREMINCQKVNLLLFLTRNSVTTGVRELNGTSQISLVTHVVVVDRRAPPLIYSGYKSADFKYWLAYNKSSVLVIIIYTCKGGLWNKSQC